MKLHHYLVTLSLALIALDCSSLLAIPFTNLFDPYDILLVKPFNKNRCFDFYVASESAFDSRAFQADPEDMADAIPGAKKEVGQFSRKADVLKIWQPAQNIFLKPDPKDFVPVTGSLKMPANIMFAAHYNLPWDIMIGLYLPFYVVELKDIVWGDPNNTTQKKLRLLLSLINWILKEHSIYVTHGIVQVLVI